MRSLDSKPRVMPPSISLRLNAAPRQPTGSGRASSPKLWFVLLTLMILYQYFIRAGSVRGKVPRVTEKSHGYTLAQFTAHHLLQSPISTASTTSPLLVLTAADAQWAELVTPQLDFIVRKYAKSTRDNDDSAKMVLVVLCLDTGCEDTCRSRGWLCYGGYQARAGTKTTIREATKILGEYRHLQTRLERLRVFCARATSN